MDNMAKVQFQMVISKVATNADWAGKVFDGWESYEVEFKGTKDVKKRQWSVWLDSPMDLAKDDVIEVTGTLITKATGEQKEWQGNVWFPVNHSVQSAQIRVISKAAPVEQPLPKPVTEFTENPPF